MMLEWLRRHDTKLDGHLRTYLLKARPSLEIEHETSVGGAAATASSRHRHPAGEEAR